MKLVKVATRGYLCMFFQVATVINENTHLQQSSSPNRCKGWELHVLLPGITLVQLLVLFLKTLVTGAQHWLDSTENYTLSFFAFITEKIQV